VERCRTTMPTAMNSADATASSTAISSRDTRVPPSLRREEYAPTHCSRRYSTRNSRVMPVNAVVVPARLRACPE